MGELWEKTGGGESKRFLMLESRDEEEEGEVAVRRLAEPQLHQVVLVFHGNVATGSA